MSPRSDSRIPALPARFASNILLLDAAEPRQLARAAAMRIAGATVQCAATAEAARALWKPGSHQLVLIDLDGAGEGFRQFYDYARAACSTQAFGFYSAEPPYLASAPGAHARKRAHGKESAALARPGESSLGQATRHIAAARASKQARQIAAEPARPSFSDAIKAAEEAAARKAAGDPNET